MRRLIKICLAVTCVKSFLDTEKSIHLEAIRGRYLCSEQHRSLSKYRRTEERKKTFTVYKKSSALHKVFNDGCHEALCQRF